MKYWFVLILLLSCMLCSCSVDIGEEVTFHDLYDPFVETYGLPTTFDEYIGSFYHSAQFEWEEEGVYLRLVETPLDFTNGWRIAEQRYHKEGGQ